MRFDKRMICRFAIATIVICLVSFVRANAVAQQLPIYEVARVTTELNIDGQLNERAWAARRLLVLSKQ